MLTLRHHRQRGISVPRHASATFLWRPSFLYGFFNAYFRWTRSKKEIPIRSMVVVGEMDGTLLQRGGINGFGSRSGCYESTRGVCRFDLIGARIRAVYPLPSLKFTGRFFYSTRLISIVPIV